MFKKLLFLVTLGLSATALFAQNIPNAKIENGPYIQAISEDGFTVVWTTTMDSISWVELAPDDDTHFYRVERPRYYDARDGVKNIGKLHAVRVDGLEKGTTYRYRIVNKTVADQNDRHILFGRTSGEKIFRRKAHKVTTLDPTKESIEFQVVNDIHDKDALFRELVKNVKQEKPDFVFFNGDMQDNMISEAQMFKGHLTSAVELFANEIPFFYARGNHEMRGRNAYNYLDYFPTTTGHTYYTVRHGPAAILVLDGGEDKHDSDWEHSDKLATDILRENCAKWLAKAVEDPAFKSAPKKIVVIHMPMYTTGRKNWWAAAEMDRLFVPILNKAGIDLSISGHNHVYSFRKKNEGNLAFPQITNKFDQKLSVKVTRDEITVNCIDTEGKVVKTHVIK